MSEHPPPSGITTAFRADVLVVAGEIDLVTAEQFEAALAHAQQLAPRLVVDISDVTFMDSTGLRALLNARRRAHDDGGEVALHLSEGGPVERLLHLAGVADMFPRRDGDG